LFADDQFKYGRFQPYITAGPAIFFSRLKDTDAINGFTPARQTASDTSVGVKGGAGLNYALTATIGLFGEYRFVYFHVNQTGINDAVLGPVAFKGNIQSYHIIAGLSFPLK
jgi:opacity protein-like surface antigen